MLCCYVMLCCVMLCYVILSQSNDVENTHFKDMTNEIQRRIARDGVVMITSSVKNYKTNCHCF